MKGFSPLLSHWHGQVKQLVTNWHGHQKKVLAMFVVGAIRAESIVVARVAEELLTETQAKVPSIERRLQRFLSNERVEVEAVWEQFLAEVLPAWRGKEVTLILDLTPFEEHAQVVSVGLLQQSRVLPLAWKVMPGQQEWEQGPWEIVAHLFERVAELLERVLECAAVALRGKKSKLGEVLSPSLCYTLSCQAQTRFASPAEERAELDVRKEEEKTCFTNLDAAYETLSAKGVRFLRPPTDQPWGLRTAYFADPEGNPWEINQPINRKPMP